MAMQIDFSKIVIGLLIAVVSASITECRSNNYYHDRYAALRQEVIVKKGIDISYLDVGSCKLNTAWFGGEINKVNCDKRM